MGTGINTQSPFFRLRSEPPPLLRRAAGFSSFFGFSSAAALPGRSSFPGAGEGAAAPTIRSTSATERAFWPSGPT